MADKELTVVLSLKDNLSAPAKQAGSAVASIGDAAKKTTGEAAKGGDSLTKMAKGVEGLARSGGDAGGVLQSLASMLGAGGGLVAGLGAAVAVTTALAKAIGDCMAEAIAWTRSASDMAAITGDSIEETSGLSAVFVAAGSNVSTLSGILQNYSRNAAEVAKGLEALGIEAHNVDGSMRTFGRVLPELANKFNAMHPGVERTNAMMQVLGRNATGAFDVLEKGSDGIRDLTNEARELGLVLDEEAAAAADRFADAMNRTRMESDALKVTVGEQVVPTFTNMVTVLDFSIREMERFSQTPLRLVQALSGTLPLETNFRQLGVAVASAMLSQSGATDKATYSTAQLERALAAAAARMVQAAYASQQMAVKGAGAVADLWKLLKGETGGGGGGSSIADMMEEESARQVESARQAGFDISKQHREMNERIDDNEAGLTAEVQEEYRKRTEAAWQEALKVKDQNGQLAADILSAEEEYQQQKTEIMKIADEEERNRKLALLERDYTEKRGDLAEQARIDEQTKKESWDRQVAQARASGAAMGDAFMESLDPDKMAADLDAALSALGKFIDSGKEMPVEEWGTMNQKIDDARAAIALMPIPESWKVALLKILDEVERRLDALKKGIEGVSQGMAAMPGAYTGAGAPGPAYPPGVNMQHGGRITEPIIGRGQWTGRGYRMGEGGVPEDVVPRGAGRGGGGGTQIIQLVVDGRVLAETVVRHIERGG